jgi:hypothetical protein
VILFVNNEQELTYTKGKTSLIGFFNHLVTGPPARQLACIVFMRHNTLMSAFR